MRALGVCLFLVAFASGALALTDNDQLACTATFYLKPNLAKGGNFSVSLNLTGSSLDKPAAKVVSDFKKVKGKFDDKTKSAKLACTCTCVSLDCDCQALFKLVALRIYKAPFSRKVANPAKERKCDSSVTATTCTGQWKTYPATYGSTSAAVLLFNYPNYAPPK